MNFKTCRLTPTGYPTSIQTTPALHNHRLRALCWDTVPEREKFCRVPQRADMRLNSEVVRTARAACTARDAVLPSVTPHHDPTDLYISHQHSTHRVSC
ncbi:hypothetical protein BaRGS_00002891 [Batillaria attramentaria]|uniref:Uncharacterized protein n=1 Tax=Batillaria attramentaria TaxID=370345 RepID=A0ABD0M244_9CAEN